MSSQLRALVGARVSVLTGPQKVSHIAQLETATKWAESKGHKIIGSFEDLGVSAEKRPEERPDLGPWLTEEGASKWDAIVWSKMDRAFRSTRHCVDFARWAEENQKVVVFAEDGLTLNYRPGAAKGIDAMMAELFVYLGSFFAQLELNRFKTRAQDSHRTLRQMDRWASGTPPLGFQIIDHPSGKGKGLDTDPDGKELLHAMATRLLDGWSFVRIADWLNEPYTDPRCGSEGHVESCECRDTGALTNLDRARVGQPNPKRDKGKWTVSVVIDALTSPRTQGLKMHKGETVLDGDGEPIRLAPATFDPDTWQQIQAAAALRQINQRTPTRSANPMLGVGVCGVCGASLAQQFSRRTLADGTAKEYRSYRCGRTPANCNGVSIRADIGDELLEQTFMDEYANDPVTKRRWVAGEDHSHELEQVNSSIERLREDRVAGLFPTPADNEVFTRQMTSLLDRRTNLEYQPTRAAGWVSEETGQTYAEAWGPLLSAMDPPQPLTEDHRQLLVDRGVRFVLTSGKPALQFHLHVP